MRCGPDNTTLFLFISRNRVKAPVREVDTGAGFFIEEGGETEKIETQIVHQEGKCLTCM